MLRFRNPGQWRWVGVARLLDGGDQSVNRGAWIRRSHSISLISPKVTLMLNSKVSLAFTCWLLSIAVVGIAARSACSAETDQVDPGTEGNGNFVIGPDYTIDPDLTDQGNPKGKYFEFSMPLADSKIFRGDDSTLDPRKPVREERKIFVYVPAAYQDGTQGADSGDA